MSNKGNKSSFADAMIAVGGIVGLIWGASMASNDPQTAVWEGALVGAILGAACVKIAGWVLGVAWQIVVGLVLLAVFFLRIVNIGEWLTQ